MAWNFGTVAKAVAAAVRPDKPALIHGSRIVTWSEFDSLTDNLAAQMTGAGLKPGDIVGHYMRNTPAYLTSFIACCKAGLTPVNINFHYKEEELRYIFETFDVKAVVYDAEFAEQVAFLKDASPMLSHYFEVADGSLANGFAEDFERATTTPAPSPVTPYEGDDAMMFIATGGTTGMPKAVMWRQRDLWVNTFYGVWPSDGDIPVEVALTLERYAELAAEQPDHSMRTRGPNMLLSPLMHGAGLLTATVTLLKGGAIITSASRKYDPSVVLDEIAANKAISVTLVGDAFAGPLAEELERRPSGKDDFASVRTVMSSGVAFNSAHKEVMIKHNPNLAIIDALGSSEAGATGAQVSTAAGVEKAPSFRPFNMEEIKIFDDDMNELPPGSEEFGMLARTGAIPLGYYGDEERTAKAFPIVNGVRYLLLGDRARITKDGVIEFKGRDNLCINTGGEKVFPEEVEDVLKQHPEVADALVVGMPHPRFGQMVTAVVRGRAESKAPSEEELQGFVKSRLAGYKAPKRVVMTDDNLRLPNGKPHYKKAKEISERELGEA